MLETPANSDRVEKESAAQKTKPGLHRPAKGWFLLFALPYLGLLWPPLYARSEPQLFGVPFFYWYQFAWVIVSAILTGIVYLMTERR